MSTLSKRIAANSDDWLYYSTEIELSQITFGEAWAPSWACFRFTNITIPNWATITSAKITLKSTANFTTTWCKVKIYGNDIDNSATWSTSNKPQDITKTTAYTSWTVPTWLVSENYDTPDFKDVVTEIVSRAWWSSWNSLSVVFEDDSSTSFNYRQVVDYSADAWTSALLTVEYTAVATNNSAFFQLF